MTSLMTLPTKDSHDTVICSEPVTIDLELSGATLQLQTDSLVVYTVEWRRWWQVWRPRCQSPGLTSPTPSPPATR
jgi:hypothetical protein